MIKILILVLFLLCILFIYKFLLRKKTSSIVNENNNVDYVPIFQLKKNNFKNLTLSEKIELSWKFLYEITEKVINSFSKEDIVSLEEIGNILLDHGVKYEHIMELGLASYGISHTKNIEETKSTQSLNNL